MIFDIDVRGVNSERGEMFLGDFLEDFVIIWVIGVGVDDEEGFDFRNMGNDILYGDEFVEMGILNCLNSKDVVRLKWVEIYIVVFVRMFFY